jgi:hypothetical protein
MMTGAVETEYEGLLDRDTLTWTKSTATRGAAE